MSFCYCLTDTLPIEKELMVLAPKGIPVQQRRQGCVNQQIQHNMVDARIRSDHAGEGGDSQRRDGLTLVL